MRYLLDTNIVSHVIKGSSVAAQQRLQQVPMTALAISAVTLGEIQYGLAKCGHPPGLTRLVREFLLRVDVLPWDAHTATCYGDLRARCQAGGITLGALHIELRAGADLKPGARQLKLRLGGRLQRVLQRGAGLRLQRREILIGDFVADPLLGGDEEFAGGGLFQRLADRVDIENPAARRNFLSP